jgi:CRP-like cAMP-binding protein
LLSEEGKGSVRTARRNRLLGALSAADVAALGHLEEVALETRQVLEAPRTPFPFVYFVETGLVSLVGTIGSNQSIEVGMIGFEGMTGTPIVLGDDRSPNEVIVQASGTALRIAATDLRKAMETSPTLSGTLLRYVNTLMAQASQTAVANGRARLDERLARWLLMWQDRLQSEDLKITHDFLSVLLGVRRASVTVALHDLEGRTLVRSTRTLIKILDREGLRTAANGFYGIPEAEYDRTIGWTGPA